MIALVVKVLSVRCLHTIKSSPWHPASVSFEPLYPSWEPQRSPKSSPLELSFNDFLTKLYFVFYYRLSAYHPGIISAWLIINLCFPSDSLTKMFHSWEKCHPQLVPARMPEQCGIWETLHHRDWKSELGEGILWVKSLTLPVGTHAIFKTVTPRCFSVLCALPGRWLSFASS